MPARAAARSRPVRGTTAGWSSRKSAAAT